MAVRIRMKKLGRLHRPFFRVCAMDIRSPRDGKVLEELGTYDPMLANTDARAVLNCERIDYWLGVGAQPSDKVKVLIKKYGTTGTHRDQQKTALAELAHRRPVPPREMPVEAPKREKQTAAAAVGESSDSEPAAAASES